MGDVEERGRGGIGSCAEMEAEEIQAYPENCFGSLSPVMLVSHACLKCAQQFVFGHF